MQMRTQHRFDLDENDDLIVTQHTDRVSLFNSNVEPVNFALQFRPCHLPVIRELILKLEALQDKQRKREEVPA